MAIEGLKDISVFRPCVVRREKDADEYRRNRRNKAAREETEETEETADPEKGKVNIKV